MSTSESQKYAHSVSETGLPLTRIWPILDVVRPGEGLNRLHLATFLSLAFRQFTSSVSGEPQLWLRPLKYYSLTGRLPASDGMG